MPVRMRLVNRIAVCFIVVVAGCKTTAPDRQSVRIDPECHELSSLVGIRVYLHINAQWNQFQIADSTIVRTILSDNDRPNARVPRNDLGLNSLRSFSKQFPSAQELAVGYGKLGYPAQLSPNGQWLAASLVESGDGGSGLPSRLVIYSNVSRQAIEISPQLPIDTIAWDPQSGRLAIVEKSHDAAPRSVNAIVASLFGWTIYFNDVALSVYDTSGGLLCRSLLDVKKADVSTLIEWR